MIQGYAVLFRRLRFNAFVLQSGFNTGAFMVMASASASLMTELLHRPATEFGVYFLLFPIGFFTGNLISTRIGNRISTETMVLIRARCWRWRRRRAGARAVLADG